MFSGNIPFHDLTNDYRIMMAVTFEGKRPLRPLHELAVIRGLDDPLWDIVEECWDADSKLRPSSDMIVERLRSQFLSLKDNRAWDDFDHSFASRTLQLQNGYTLAGSTPRTKEVLTGLMRQEASEPAGRANHSSRQPPPDFDTSSGGPKRANSRSSLTSFQDEFSNLADPDYPPQWSPSLTATGYTNEEDSPFNSITEDLQNRVLDWNGDPLSSLGPLQMYDLLLVRRDSLVREFSVYLFKEALICMVEDKKRSLGRLLLSSAGSGPNLGALRMKGRIYGRHIKKVTASSAGEMTLTLDIEHEEINSFVLIFRQWSSLETWKTQIQSLMNNKSQQPRPQAPLSPNPHDKGPVFEESSGSATAAPIF